MTFTFSDTDIMKMKGIILDVDHDEAIKFIKEIVKRLEQQKNAGMKSHLDS